MSLKDPKSKMSKSHQDPLSRILITDSEDEIKSKIKKALTDTENRVSYDPEKRPGVSNLIEILRHASNSSKSCEELVADLGDLTLPGLKDLVSQSVIACLSGVRDLYMELLPHS